MFSGASPVLWDGQHCLRGDTCIKATSTSCTKVCKEKYSMVGFQGGRYKLQVPSRELEEQKREQKIECNALRKKTQSWTGSEKGRDMTRIQISLWKWKNGSKWDGNEKKYSWEAKGTTGKKKTHPKNRFANSPPPVFSAETTRPSKQLLLPVGVCG